MSQPASRPNTSAFQQDTPRQRNVMTTDGASASRQAAPAAVYEYQARVDGRWQIQQVFNDEPDAIGAAQTDIIAERHAHVRVLKTWPNDPDLNLKSRVVYTRETVIENTRKPGQLGKPPANPPLCRDPHDLYEAGARLTLNRLFAGYCDEHGLLVSDILYDKRLLDRLLQHSSLIGQAINLTAQAQAKTKNLRRRRRQTIMDIVQAMRQVTQAMPRPPADADAMLAERLQFLPDLRDLPPEELANQRRLLSHALLMRVKREGSTTDQFIYALSLIDLYHDPMLDEAVDLLLSDLVHASELSETITGLSSNLGERLIRLMRLAEGAELTEDGKRPTKDQELNIAIARLRVALKRGRLPSLRHHLIDQVNSVLTSGNALEARDENTDDQLYRMVLETAARFYHLLEEPDFVEAITSRFHRHSEIECNDRVAAARHVSNILEQPGLTILYQATLYKLFEDPDLRRYLMGHIREVLEHSIDLNMLLPAKMSHRARLARMRAAFDSIARMPASPEWRRSTLSLVDEAMWLYIEESGITAKPSHDPATARDQIFKLAELCSADILPEGSALNHLRDRLLKQVRHPDFDKKLTVDISDPIRAEAARKAFKQKFAATGLRT
ncbi:MAG: hypothetical protein KI792_00815 [Alphaproteobacteria bacterium]|nr:hypothetical protein [Alphaproteobacteria bacterium SS10]